MPFIYVFQASDRPVCEQVVVLRLQEDITGVIVIAQT